MKRNNLTISFNEESLVNIDIIGEIIREKNNDRIIASALNVAKTILKEVKKKKTVILISEDGKQELYDNHICIEELGQGKSAINIFEKIH